MKSPITRWIRINRFLVIITFFCMVVALYLVFIYAPQEKIMGEVQRIFYFHVASAWLGLFAFFVVFLASVLFLWKGAQKHDRPLPRKSALSLPPSF